MHAKMRIECECVQGTPVALQPGIAATLNSTMDIHTHRLAETHIHAAHIAFDEARGGIVILPHKWIRIVSDTLSLLYFIFHRHHHSIVVVVVIFFNEKKLYFIFFVRCCRRAIIVMLLRWVFCVRNREEEWMRCARGIRNGRSKKKKKKRRGKSHFEGRLFYGFLYQHVWIMHCQRYASAIPVPIDGPFAIPVYLYDFISGPAFRHLMAFAVPSICLFEQ